MPGSSDQLHWVCAECGKHFRIIGSAVPEHSACPKCGGRLSPAGLERAVGVDAGEEPVLEAVPAQEEPAAAARPAGGRRAWLGIAGGMVVAAAVAIAIVLWGGHGEESGVSASGSAPASSLAGASSAGDAAVVGVKPHGSLVAEKDKIRMAIRFTPGSYVVEEKSRQDMQMMVEGRTINVVQAMTITGDVEIGEPDGNRDQKVRFICRRIRLTASGSGEAMDFDSDLPSREDESGPAAVLRAMVGWEGTLTGRDGRWVRVEGVGDLMARVRQAAPGGGGQGVGQLEAMMDDFLREMLLAHWGELIPQEPIGVGDQWRRQMKLGKVPMLGEMVFDADCGLRAIEDGPGGRIAKIDYRVKTDLSDRRMDMAALGAPSSVEARIGHMSISGTGTADFDTGIGLSRHVTANMTMRGNVNVRAQGQSAVMNFEAQVQNEETLIRKGGPAGSGESRDVDNGREDQETRPDKPADDIERGLDTL